MKIAITDDNMTLTGTATVCGLNVIAIDNNLCLPNREVLTLYSVLLQSS